MASMSDHVTDNHFSMLEATRQNFEKWRADRKYRSEPIPQYLWQAAIGLCRVHGISQVCRHLRLSYTALKKHLGEDKPASIHFKALDLSPLAGQWQMDCSRPDGIRLQISGNGELPDIKNILGMFLS
jgi:hypothetical protein